MQSPPKFGEWADPEDFDLENASWIDVTTISDEHEVQVDGQSGIYRHRMRIAGSKWIKGKPNE